MRHVIFTFVAAAVALTSGEVSAQSCELTGTCAPKPAPRPTPPPPKAKPKPKPKLSYCEKEWRQASKTHTKYVYEEFIYRCPGNGHVAEARRQIGYLTPPPPPPPPPPPSSPTPNFADYTQRVRLFPAYNGENYTNEDYAVRIARFLKQYNFRRNPMLVTDRMGLMWYGRDVVAARDQNKLASGYAAYSAVWEGAIWLFESKANLDKFLASPTTYRPAYGGLCAYCLATNSIVIPDVAGTFNVPNGNLFFYGNPANRTDAMKNINKTIIDANRVWTGMKSTDMPQTGQISFSVLISKTYDSKTGP